MKPPGLFQDFLDTFCRKPSVDDLRKRELYEHERALLKAEEDLDKARANITIFGASVRYHSKRIDTLKEQLHETAVPGHQVSR